MKQPNHSNRSLSACHSAGPSEQPTRLGKTTQPARRATLLLLAASALLTLIAASSASASQGRRPVVRSGGSRTPVARTNPGYRGVHRGDHGTRGSWSRSRQFYGGFYSRPSFYSSWYWPGYFYRPYGAYAYYGDGGYYGGYGAYYQPDAGALDLDIRPEEASIYLDGELIGVADNYDGWPRYLWLREGTYRLVIYKEGFETLAREVRIRPGEVLSLSDRMQPGDSKRPEELFAQVERTRPQTTVRAPEGEVVPQRDDDWRARERAPARAPDVAERDWRDRESRPPLAADQRAAPARLRLVVAPADAVVYLDGRLLGSGEQLSRLHSDLIVDPGSHRIEITRPGYRSYSLELDLAAGVDREVVAELEPAG